jgi:hypothetical protein
MHSHLHLLLRYAWYFLWLVPHFVFLPAIAFLMLRRGWHRSFPCFFSYAVYEAVIVLINFPLSRSSISDWSYAIIEAVISIGSISLRYAVVYEVFRHISRQYPSLARVGKTLFMVALIVLLVLAITAGMLQTGANAGRLARIGTSLQWSMSLIQCGLLIFLLMFSSYFKLSWDNFGLGIAIGTGVYASVNLASMVAWAQFAPISHDTQVIFDFILMGTYQCCVLIWLGYLLAPRTVRATNTLPVTDLELWSNELQQLVQR